jgi:tetratricopeptide (TPR) repeat protein
MPQAELLREQAETCMAEAPDYEREGLTEEVLAVLRRAVLLYAAADSTLEPLEAAGSLKRARADACRAFGTALATAGRHAEAANIFQEATDLYGLFEDEEARILSKECARSLLDNVAALRSQPHERLHLLTAHYERAQQQLALEPDTEAKQAECAVHIARIYQRRERPAESVERYQEALDLYSRSHAAEEVQLARAECHHRIATLLAVPLDNAREAIHHYRSAIALYAASEPAFDGVQPSLEICRVALARIEVMLERQDYRRDREWSHD